jgi:hypothetical protein
VPFRAFVDGVSCVSTRLTEDEWQSLRARLRAGQMPIRLECCNAHVILNRSPCGRRFFAHRNQPPECNWKPESIEHIELKAELHPMSEWSALLINARRRGAEAETAERLKRQQDEIGMNQVDEWLRNR